MYLIKKSFNAVLACCLSFGCNEQHSKYKKTERQEQCFQSERNTQHALHAKVYKLVHEQHVLKFYSLKYILSDSPENNSVIYLSLKSNGKGDVGIYVQSWDPNVICYSVSFIWKLQDGWITCNGQPVTIYQDDVGIWIPVRKDITPISTPITECYQWMPELRHLNQCDRLYMMDSISMDKIKWLLSNYLYDIGNNMLL